MTTTIYDVAREASVSVATVSRVLNAPTRVSPAKRAAVLEAVSRLQYVPRAEASERARRDLGRIGVIVPYFSSPSFVQRLRGVAAALARSHHELVVYTVEDSEQLLDYLTTLPITRRIDGLIVMSVEMPAAAAGQLARAGLPTVFVEVQPPGFTCVVVDNRDGGRLAAECLAARSPGPFAFIGNQSTADYAIRPGPERLEGFRAALAERGLRLTEQYVCFGDTDPVAAAAMAEVLLDLPVPPRAIFAATDLQAVGVVRAAARRRLRVPEELAVIGFDGLDLADYLELSTIDQSLDESGRVAAELLLARLRDPERPIQVVRLPVQMRRRATA